MGQAAAGHDPIDGHTPALEGVDDHARAERGRLEQRAVDLVRTRRQREPDDETREIGVDEHGAVAVPPVEREQAALARPRAPPPALRAGDARPHRAAARPRRPAAARRSRRTTRRCRRRPTGPPRSRRGPARRRPRRRRTSPRPRRDSSPRRMWQLLVPMITTSSPGAMQPTAGADTCASTFATATGVPGSSPVQAAARSPMPPARPPMASMRRDIFSSTTSAKRGSSAAKYVPRREAVALRPHRLVPGGAWRCASRRP